MQDATDRRYDACFATYTDNRAAHALLFLLRSADAIQQDLMLQALVMLMAHVTTTHQAAMILHTCLALTLRQSLCLTISLQSSLKFDFDD